MNHGSLIPTPPCLKIVDTFRRPAPLATEVTARAATELPLTAGKPVYLILKTAGCVVYGGRGQ